MASALSDILMEECELPVIEPHDLVTAAQRRTCQCVFDNYNHLAKYGTALRQRIDMTDYELLESVSTEQLQYSARRADEKGVSLAHFLRDVYTDLYKNLHYVLLRALYNSDPLLLAYDILVTADDATGIFALDSMERLLRKWTT